KYQKLVKSAYASDKSVFNQLALAIEGKYGDKSGEIDLTVESNDELIAVLQVFEIYRLGKIFGNSFELLKPHGL
ncbi:34015_t:CDS:2, partial [Gigaspora margarita]